MDVNLVHPDYVELRARIRENPKDFVAVVGSGLSVPAGLPDWLALKLCVIDDGLKRISDLANPEQQELRESLERIIDIPDLWLSFSKLKAVLDRNAYEQSIKNCLTTRGKMKIPRPYELLWKLDIKGIVNFNLDTFALDCYSSVRPFTVDCATHQDVSRYKQFAAGTQDFVFHPHGVIGDAETWVLTEEEKTKLLSKTEYTAFMDTLLRAKNMLVMGFNPDDFAFGYLLQHATLGGTDTGAKHYIFMANPNYDFIKSLGDRKIAVIPYSPEDPKLHKEIEVLLEDILAYVPKDTDASSAYCGEIIAMERMPSDEQLQRRSVDEIRRALNGAIAGIIPANREATKDDYDKLGAFYKDYLFSLNKAWIVEPASKSDILYGHKIVSIVGRGAFGVVFNAEKIQGGNRVAVKMLLPDIRSDQDYLRSFRRGIRSMRILTQRNVLGMVRFIDAYEVPACVFMEYVDGPNLYQAVDMKILDDLLDRLRTLIQIGEIVHRAHNLEERVLHRDLKPANVILKDYYLNHTIDAVVLDFDLSWHKGASDLSVVHGARAQGYAAPEQTATGRTKGISTRHTSVDVFGYGMLAYFVLTGNDPRPNEQNFEGFKGGIAEVIEKSFDPSGSTCRRT
ncbi:MAG: protein kinase [Chloroflexi bacterium]|nr:protein kinase [Chloroflexota bacterium]